MKSIINKSIMATVIAGSLFSSCKDDEFFGEVAPRLFSPVNLEQTVDLSEVHFTWQSVKDAVGYTLEIASDSSFSGTVTVYRTTATTLSISDLDFESTFVPRIKANASVSEMDSKYIFGKPFTTPNAPVVLKSPDEIGRDYVILQWDREKSVDNLRVSELSNPDSFVDYPISAEEQSDGLKRIDALAAATTFQAVIMSNGQRFNKVSFRTKDALPAGTIEVPANADLKQYLDMANEAVGASVLALAPGAEYELPESYQIRKDITLICEGTVKPLIRVKQLNIAGSVGTVRFENLNITGSLSDGTYGDYFIKLIANTEANGDKGFNYMEELILRDVEIHDFTRSVVRHEAKGGGYGKLTVEKALVYNFGEAGQRYALFHMGDDAKVNVYDIRHTTFHNFMFGLIQQQKASQQNYSELVNIENCTLYNYGSDTYFANFKGHDGGTFNIKNCIFGKVIAPEKFKGIYGVKSSTAVGFTLNVSASFNTSDYGTTSNAIKGLVGVDKNSEEFFENASIGNFKVTDNAYAASGDSRWN
ncbi:MAG: DUF5123 domain-containing protein [Bacteroidales bacterium]